MSVKIVGKLGGAGRQKWFVRQDGGEPCGVDRQIWFARQDKGETV
ncbi:hypothetical protein [Bacillus yapensis]|nr:hypothetical protein [Bacillus yapensis]